MSIVKHLNGWKLPPLPKRPFRYWIKSTLPTLFFSMIVGTYLDLIMVGKHLYYFPLRAFPHVFSINIFFNLIGLPTVVLIFLFLMGRWEKKWKKGCLITGLSLAMSFFELKSEQFGLFAHSDQWKHLYTFVGYCLFLIVVYLFHIWVKKRPL